MVRHWWLALALTTASCVTAPSRIDVAALVKKHGAANARHTLEIRIVDDPKDLAARLALAKLCEQQGRPSQAIEQLEAVVRIGGVIGTRWHDEDRARLARLLAARGRARTARGAPTAITDLERARDFGAKITDDDLARARLARAISRVRHVDARERTAALKTLRELASVPRDRGARGAWLWSIGAKRAAWEELAAWHAATPPSARSEALQSIYLAAHAWWTPVDGAPPAAADLVGPARCRYRAASCDPWDLVQNGITSDAIDALLVAPPSKASDPDDAFAWLAITLARALRGDAPWGASFAARVDVAALGVDAFPAGGRAAFAMFAGRDDAARSSRDDTARTSRDDTARTSRDDTSDRTTPTRFLAAATLALRDGNPDDIRAQLGPLADTPEGTALLAIASQPAVDPIAKPHAAAVARYIDTRLGLGTKAVDMRSALHDTASAAEYILNAYAIDPAQADRIASDVVATFADGALGHAFVGTLFDAIQDPARARASWQAAVDASPEPLFLRGLAEAVARANDPDAALIFATNAAAASGDPAPVWIAIAEALHAHGSSVHALEAARYALDLASIDTIGAALDVAIAASDALGRTTQANHLRTRRASVAPPILVAARDNDPTDPHGALASGKPDRMWTASRWNPRDVKLRVALLAALANDPRRNTIVNELVALAGDRDIERARAAIRALRDKP